MAVLALAARIVFRLEVGGDPLFSLLAIDARSYFELGRRFAAGDLLLGQDPLWFSPLYPAFVGTLFRLLGEDPRVVVLVQHALGIGTALLATVLGSRVSPVAGRTAGIMLALSPVALFYEGQLLYAAVTTFAVAGFLLAFVRARSSGRMQAAFGAGLLLGVVALLRTNALLFGPFALVLLAGRSRRVRPTLSFAGGVAVILVLLVLRNGAVGGAWTPFSVNGGMILATGFAEDALGGRALTRTPEDFGPGGAYEREAEAALGRDLTLAEASDWHRARALDSIAADPARAARLTLAKLGVFLNAREIDDQIGFPLLAERSRVLRAWPLTWAFFLLPAVVGAGIALTRRDDAASEVRTHALFALVWAGSLLPFFVTARYRFPVVVPLAVLSGYAVAQIAHVARVRPAGSRRALALAVGAAVVLAPFVLREGGLRADPAYAWNAVAAGLVRAGRHGEAVAVADRAIALQPDLAGAHVNRALALSAAGQPEEAMAAAERAARLDPDLSAAWRTWGALAARLGHYDIALPAFRRDAQLRPGDPAALSNLASVYAALGDYAEAERVGRLAVAAGARDLEPHVREWGARKNPPAGAEG